MSNVGPITSQNAQLTGCIPNLVSTVPIMNKRRKTHRLELHARRNESSPQFPIPQLFRPIDSPRDPPHPIPRFLYSCPLRRVAQVFEERPENELVSHDALNRFDRVVVESKAGGCGSGRRRKGRCREKRSIESGSGGRGTGRERRCEGRESDGDRTARRGRVRRRGSRCCRTLSLVDLPLGSSFHVANHSEGFAVTAAEVVVE